MKERLPNVDTFACLADRLAVEIHKVGILENRKRDEQAKENPDDRLVRIWDNASREACELRSKIKVRINELLTEIVESGSYNTAKEVRTFSPPKKSVADILEEMYTNTANSSLRGELAATIEEELKK